MGITARVKGPRRVKNNKETREREHKTKVGKRSCCWGN
jgi:hypothetical protein